MKSLVKTTIFALIILTVFGCGDNSNSPVEETPCVEPTIIHDTIIDSITNNNYSYYCNTYFNNGVSTFLYRYF